MYIDGLLDAKRTLILNHNENECQVIWRYDGSYLLYQTFNALFQKEVMLKDAETSRRCLIHSTSGAFAFVSIGLKHQERANAYRNIRRRKPQLSCWPRLRRCPRRKSSPSWWKWRAVSGAGRD
jgi:hypothetical protein